MRRLGPTALVLAATLAGAGMVNYATACCCGDSVFSELWAGCCATADHGAHGRGPIHHGAPGHTCYKDGRAVWLLDSGPSGHAPAPLIAEPLPAAPPHIAPVFAGTVPPKTGAGPPAAAVPGGPSCCWLL